MSFDAWFRPLWPQARRQHLVNPTGPVRVGAATPMDDSLQAQAHTIGRDRVVQASAWRSGAYFLSKALQVASNVILASLLAPAVFGLLALSDAVLRGLRMFSEIGVGPAIIQSSHWRDESFLNTAWTLHAIRGLGIWMVATAVAYPMSILYGERALAFLLPAMGVTAAIRALDSTVIFTLNRQLLEKQRVVLHVAERVVTRGVAIAIALVWPSVWAIVAGAILGSIFECVASHRLLPSHRHRFEIDREAARAIGRFGIWIFVGTVIAFFGQQIDRLLLGKLGSLGVLGVYSIALGLAQLPKEAASQLSQQILYPVLTDAVHRDALTFRRRLSQARSLILPGGILCVLGVIFIAPWFFASFYDNRYRDAAWIAPLASIGVWFALLNGSIHHALMALGATRPLAVSGAVKLFAGGLGCLVGFELFGLPGFVVGIALGEFGQHLYDSLALASHGVSLIWQDAGYSLLLLAGAVVGLVALPVGDIPAVGEELPYRGLAVQGALLTGVGLWCTVHLLRTFRGKERSSRR